MPDLWTVLRIWYYRRRYHIPRFVVFEDAGGRMVRAELRVRLKRRDSK